MYHIYQPEAECMPIEQLRALQLERLQATAARVYKNVPAYKAKFDAAGVKPEDIRSLDDLRKFPFTYKQDFRDNYPYGLFAVPLKDVVRIHASSGTTGKQKVVGYTRNDLKVWGDLMARTIGAG
ncbi:MAG: phenylacetate--CoA ligase, partial [Oscillospiraceae bacterium]|nr:phenylacetate--CoA ligase [Oscillospiraceae bacterium]